MERGLDLSATNAAELINVAGGWLCDRAMAGWTVTVWVPKLDYAQPLAILGVSARELVDKPVDEVDAVVLHGYARPGIVRDRHDCVRHRVSVAARAFKARALLAAGLPSCARDFEMFWLAASSNLLPSRDFSRTSASAVAP